MNSILLFPALPPWMTTTTVFVLLTTTIVYFWTLSPTSLLDRLESLCCDKSAKDIKQRSHVLKELLQSEINYVQGLSFVADQFVQPFLDTNCTTTVEEVFNGWLPITTLHQDFLKNLQQALCGIEESTTPRLGSTLTAARLAAIEFSKLAPCLILYIPFVEKYNSALSKISQDLRSNGAISQQIDVTTARKDIAQGKLNGGLGPLLALPFQRLCKYGLLLRELSKTFHKNGRTGTQIYQAMTSIDAIVLKVNDAKASGENGERIFEIQTCISESKMVHIPRQLRVPLAQPLLQPARRLLNQAEHTGLAEHTLPMNQKQDASETKSNYLILFSDILLFVHRTTPTKWKEEKIVLVHCIALNALTLIEPRKSDGPVGGGQTMDKGEREEEDVKTVLHWQRPRPWCGLALVVAWEKHGKDGVAFEAVLRIALSRYKNKNK